MTTTPSEAEKYAEANRDPEVSPKRVTLLYGDIGSRKTTTAASLVNERGLLLSTDDSWKVLLNDRHKDIYDKLKITPLEGLSQFNYINFEGYDTVIWDTASHTVDSFLDLLYDEADWAGKFRDKITTNNAELKRLKIAALAPMDYRVTRDTLRPIFRKLFVEIDAHIIITSQFKKPVPGLSKDEQIRPDIPGATLKIIGEKTDLIAHTKVTSGKYVVDFSNNLTQLGKTRIEGIDGSMDTATFIRKYKEIVFK